MGPGTPPQALSLPGDRRMKPQRRIWTKDGGLWVMRDKHGWVRAILYQELYCKSWFAVAPLGATGTVFPKEMSANLKTVKHWARQQAFEAGCK